MLPSLGYSCIAIPMVNFNSALAVEVRIENITVAVLFPPSAQLAIPNAVQPIDKAGEFVSQQRVVVLIA